MARRTNRISVYAPRKHGRRWRIEIRDGATGRRERPGFDSEEEAWQAYEDARKEALRFQAPTVGEMIDAYHQHLVEKGNKPKSIKTTLYRLNRFFTKPNTPLPDLSPERIQAMYDIQRNGLSVDSHRNELAEVKSFLRWCMKTGELDNNPSEHVEGIGKRKKGKKQLRPSEAKLLFDRALELSAAGNDGALAVLIALLTGLRAQEITRRLVRDADALTKNLYVEDDVKTEASSRRVELPDILWPHIEQRIRGRPPDAPIFPAKSQDGFHHPEWVADNTKRLCKALGLPLVCAHGLRGSHSSIAQEAGATGHLVSKQLGHVDEKTTREHYTEADLGKRKNRERVFTLLSGGRKD